MAAQLPINSTQHFPSTEGVLRPLTHALMIEGKNMEKWKEFQSTPDIPALSVA
ncbi:hypothetical protein K443DRAFT_10773 [Laccaria amethystina LaAM-08-1]|uniref:Uncharacterized protein n=1 Tax=Laccaria amethystina LaAM-08-1 TaxID=1095629 RepID=A0A0C9XJ23_9AGAR|nr:hypothetical protein K443DRAFT_10773 [Laccaria amethystina LaAM-08-1]